MQGLYVERCDVKKCRHHRPTLGSQLFAIHFKKLRLSPGLQFISQAHPASYTFAIFSVETVNDKVWGKLLHGSPLVLGLGIW